MKTVVVQVPAFEEPQRLPATLSAIRSQTYPSGYTIYVEAWVTPSRDDSGVCSTLQAAQSVLPSQHVYEAPNGKLSTRNTAHDHARESGADLILSWDADAGPLHDNVLQSIVTTAVEPGVAAANSIPVSRDGTILGEMVDLAARVEDTLRPHLHGQLQAITPDAWDHAGPFVTTSESNAMKVRREEEYSFRKRVAEVGDVVTAPNAEVYNDPRRHYCRLPGNSTDEYCKRIGQETF